MPDESSIPHSQLEKAAPFGRTYLFGGLISIALAFRTVPKWDYVAWIHLGLLVIWLIPWVRKGSIPCHIRLTLASTWVQLIVSFFLIASVHQEMMQSFAQETHSEAETSGYYLMGFFSMSIIVLIPWILALLKGYRLILLGHRTFTADPS
ncbi:hypothetical protein HW115_13860 [Verrucomicrobiaceae bacterium N1E253]|uniref:Transmembrane protein n=1 Tax=Oceaniferula marina TaxID=2748318 RepID=A0A851GR74_9BACT|nr:hypothetical protein [Oceaniferula marina]NWK56704.1 hypothetical protein [Oceaniferula marina]